MRRIAMTGMGAVTPFGIGVERLWNALFDGESAISEMDLFDLKGLPCTRAGVCRFLKKEKMGKPRALRLAEIACEDALSRAGELPKDTAIITATNFGSAAETFSLSLDDDVNALAEKFGLDGIRIPISLSCASGASALALAAQMIAAGRMDRALVVGYDALTPFAWSGLCSLRTMTKDTVRPFDVNRSGTIFSEGAAAVLLESEESANSRHAQIAAWVAGWATGNNGFHLTAPAPRGAGSKLAMESALAVAGMRPEQIMCIQAHGTGTKANDLTESQAIHDLFGERAAHIPVTSIKGALGHLLGASSSAEVIIAALSLQRQAIPPTQNCDTPDPECPLSIVTAKQEKAARTFDNVLCNAAGFGGCNAAILLAARPPACVGWDRPHLSCPARGKAEPIPVTGIGAVCALGTEPEEIAAAWQEGEAPESFAVPEFDLQEFGITPKSYVDPASKNLLAVCGMALAQDPDAKNRDIGIMAGTASGCGETEKKFFEDYTAKGPRFVRPFLFPHTYANTPASLVAMEKSLMGPHLNVAGGVCASGIALLAAVDALRQGRAKCIVVGGTDVKAGGQAAAALTLRAPGPCTNPVGWILGCGVAASEEMAVAQACREADIQADKIARRFVNEPGAKTVKLCGDVGGTSTTLDMTLALLVSKENPVLILTRSTGCCIAVLSAAR